MSKTKSATRSLPRIVHTGDCHQFMVDGQPIILLAGEMQNSSASNLEYLESRGCWKHMQSYNCNAALVPVYWELIEPEEGRFDFSLVGGVIRAARRHGLRLVLLWFGTWKNATSSYVPAYVKTDLARFPRCQLAPGRTSRTISPFCDAACRADSRAFAQLMRFIKRVDARRQTVVMLQVQNETGLLGAARDHSPPAEKAFNRPVPSELTRHLGEGGEQLHPAIRECLARPRRRGEGTWSQVFGRLAAEAFMAWHIGRYVQRVAAAGKAVYSLPMFVNAWLDYGSEPGRFPSGGPVARMLDIWHAAAPAVDAFAPDIYCKDFKRPCADFVRPFNPLIVPESVPERAAQHAFWVVGEHRGLCFSPFGIDHPHCWPDTVWQPAGLAEVYAMLRNMMPAIAGAQALGRTRGVLQTADQEDRVRLGDYELTIRYTHKLADGRTPGAGLILQLDADEFVVAGQGFLVRFMLAAGQREQADWLWAEQGYFRDGRWTAERRLNGDDTWDNALRLPGAPELSTRRGKLYRYT